MSKQPSFLIPRSIWFFLSYAKH